MRNVKRRGGACLLSKSNRAIINVKLLVDT